MARRAPVIKKKIKKVRIGKTEAYLTNLKFLGDEPKFTKALSQMEYARALTWYNYMCTAQDAREYLQVFFRETERPDDLQKLRKVSDNLLPLTAAWISRMWTRGFELPESSYSFFEKSIEEAYQIAERLGNFDESKDNLPKPTVRDRVKEKQSDLIAEIEEMLDLDVEFSLYDWLKLSQVPATYMPAIIAKYSPIVLELVEALEGTDPQLVEGYSYLSKSELEDKVVFYSSLIEDAERYSQVEKKARAPRKTKPVPVEKQIKNLKYQVKDDHYNVTSVKPDKIIGAQELWTFNTKYKTLTVLRALDRGGLKVKGTSILNYDETTSMSRKTGRKSEEVVKKINEGGKLVLRKIMDELKTVAPVAYRINENTILLKAIV